MPRARLIYLLPPLVLGSWGAMLLGLYAGGRLRVLLNPLFWSLELVTAVVLLGLAAGYFLLFRPVERSPAAGPARRVFLQMTFLLGSVLAAVGLAPNSLSAAALDKRAGLSGGKILASISSPPAAGADLSLIDFAAAAYFPEQIPSTTGKTVSFVGQYFDGPPGEFRFCRVLISCCAQDATPIYLHIVGTAPGWQPLQWISVKGTTFFRKNEDDVWEPCLKLTGVSSAQPPPDPYLYAVRLTPKPN